MNIDAYAEKAPNLTPFRYGFNNPINVIDPDGNFEQDDFSGRGVYFNVLQIDGGKPGQSIGISAGSQENKGGSIGVVQNKDGTYRIVSGKNDGKTGVFLADKKGEYNAETSEKIGDQFTPHSFRLDNNEVVKDAIIDLKSNEGQNFINDLVDENPSAIDYGINATGGEKYDFKTNNMNKNANEVSKTLHKYRGSVLSNGRITSARDVGNIGASIVAGRSGVSWTTFRLAADGLQSKQQRKVSFEKVNSQLPQAFGFLYGRDLRKKKIKTPSLKSFQFKH